MLAIDKIESKRLEVQSLLDATKTQVERNKLGQFATPPILATDMLEYAKLYLSPSLQLRFLDPAIGTGSFLTALFRTFPESQISEVRGFEIDAEHAQKTVEIWHDNPLKLDIADFTYAAPPNADEAKANLLICNPPYVRHHHLLPEEKRRLQNKVVQITGIRLNGQAGLYCYFLCLAHAWMAENALAGWLIPSEFMEVNYGQQLKQYLLNHTTLLRVHRFDPKDLQFDDALVSSAIVWLKNVSQPKNHTIEFSYGGKLNTPIISKRFSLDTVRNTTKWTQLPFSDERGEPAIDTHIQLGGNIYTQARQKGPTLSDLFDIKRGLATGANKFFLLTQEQIISHRLPEEFFVPVLPSPRYVADNDIASDRNGNPLLDKKIFLLMCSLPEAEVKAHYPLLWVYLQRGIASGIHDGYLCKHRVPWYSQEDRPPSPLLCTYMGRQSTEDSTPFRFILNHSQAT